MPVTFAHAPLWFDGFDAVGVLGAGPSFQHEHYAFNWTGANSSVIAGRYSGFAVRSNFSNPSGFANEIAHSLALVNGDQTQTTQDWVRTQVSIRIAGSYPSSKKLFFYASVLGSQRFSLHLDSSGIVTIQQIGTVYGTASVALPLDTWFTLGIEAKFVNGVTSQREVGVYVNGSLLVSATAIGLNGEIALGHFLPPSNCGTGFMDLDDWVVWEPSVASGHVGAFEDNLRVETRWVNGNVQEQYTATPNPGAGLHYTNVYDNDFSQSINTNLSGQEDIYEVDDMIDDPAVILGVMAGGRTGSTAGELGVEYAGTTTYYAGNGDLVFKSPPGLSPAWNKSQVNAARWHVKSVSASYHLVTRAYLMVLRSNELAQRRRRVIVMRKRGV